MMTEAQAGFRAYAGVVAEVPVTVAEAVPQAGLIGRLWDGLRLTIK